MQREIQKFLKVDKSPVADCQAATLSRIPEQTVGRVGGRAHFQMRMRFLLSEASTWPFFRMRLHGRRVRA